MSGIIGALYLMGAFTLAGTSVIAASYLKGVLGPFTIAAVALFFAGMGLLPFCGYRLRDNLFGMTRYDKVQLLAQAFLGIFLFRWFLLQGLMRTSAAEAGVLTGAMPAITSLLAWLLLKEGLNRERLLGIFSTVMGVLTIQGVFAPGAIGFSNRHWTGNLLVLSAVSCESLFNVLSRMSSLKDYRRVTAPLSPLERTFWVAMIAMMLCIVPALAEKPIVSLASLGVEGWAALLWYGWVVTAVAFVLWYAGIQRCDASVAAVFSGMMPLSALFLSVLVLGEQPGYQGWIGGLFIAAGMLLTGIKDRRSVERQQTRYIE